MNTALVFAGGTGRRMNSRAIPNQFIEIHVKPILIYTLEHFEYHEEIDNMVVVCLKDWIEIQGAPAQVRNNQGYRYCSRRRDRA